MKGQFSPHNGKPGGSSQPSASSGSGGKGTGATGKLKGGRKLLRWSAPSVRLQKKERVVVNVWVDADGNVTRAEAVSGPDNLRSACVKASLKAKWEKGSAPSTRGSITWTLVPATR